jgi:hypothetical protein
MRTRSKTRVDRTIARIKKAQAEILKADQEIQELYRQQQLFADALLKINAYKVPDTETAPLT